MSAAQPLGGWAHPEGLDAAGPGASVVALLCPPEQARPAAAAAAIALARRWRTPAALAAVVGVANPPASLAAPGAASRAAALRRAGRGASAVGRVVWLDATGEALGAAGVAAASVALRLASSRAGLPAVLAVAGPRDRDVDQALRWHDGILVAEHGEADPALRDLALESLRALGRPVAAFAVPPRGPAGAALAGVRAPADALRAVRELTSAQVRP